MVTLLQSEVLVLAASGIYVLYKTFMTLSLDVSVPVIVCLASQYGALTVQTLYSETQPGIMKYFRSKADPGYLCSMLVPLAVVADIVHISSNSGVADSMYVSSVLGYVCFTSTQCTLFMNSTRANTDKTKGNFTSCCTSILILAAELSSIFLIAKLDWPLIVLSIFQAYIIYSLHHILPRKLPRCFSLGELSCVLQLVGVVLWRSGHSLTVSSWNEEFDLKSFHIDCIHSILIISVTAIAYLNHLPNFQQRGGVRVYVIIGVVALVFVIPSTYFLLGQNIVRWVINSIVGRRRTMGLFIYWVVFSVVAWLLVACGNPDSNRHGTKTMTRKYFHLIVVAVYIPGLIVDAEFLHLASIFAGAAFVVLEVIRVYAVPPLGKLIDRSFRTFVDEKDEGEIILTHIYLLIGLSLPLWISSSRPLNGSHLSLYSGVISLGIGDTVASIGGTLCGKHKWQGSKKSIEGTVLCAIAQSLAVCILFIAGAVSHLPFATVIIPVILSSLFEAFTHQIDNLVLPLLTYSLFCVG